MLYYLWQPAVLTLDILSQTGSDFGTAIVSCKNLFVSLVAIMPSRDCQRHIVIHEVDLINKLVSVKNISSRCEKALYFRFSF